MPHISHSPAAGRVPSENLRITACGREWLIERASDLETLWRQMDEQDFSEDERLPYWTEIWPASLLLATWLEEAQIRLSGKRCLDLGCGLGLTALIAASYGALVTGMDYEFEALRYARRNIKHNRTPDVLFTQVDWRAPAFKPKMFDFIWGGDIVYETRFYEPLRDLFRECLAPSGRIWMAEPQRSVSTPVWERLAEDGFKVRKLTTRPVPVEGYTVTVNLWELTNI